MALQGPLLGPPQIRMIIYVFPDLHFKISDPKM